MTRAGGCRGPARELVKVIASRPAQKMGKWDNGAEVRGLEEEEVNWTRRSQNGVIAQLTPPGQSQPAEGGERGRLSGRAYRNGTGTGKHPQEQPQPSQACSRQARQARHPGMRSPPPRPSSLPDQRATRSPRGRGKAAKRLRPTQSGKTRQEQESRESRKQEPKNHDGSLDAERVCGFAPCCTPSARPARAQHPCPPSPHLASSPLLPSSCPQRPRRALCPAAQHAQHAQHDASSWDKLPKLLGCSWSSTGSEATRSAQRWQSLAVALPSPAR